MMTHEPSIFDRIIEGSIPCHRVYEDDKVLAFLDIGPLSPGHTLVIPKERCAFLHEMSEESGAAIGRILPRLARAIIRATGATHYNILQNNGADAHQAVFHVHFHIIPRFRDSDQGAGLELQWNSSELSQGDASDLLDLIHSALESESG